MNRYLILPVLCCFISCIYGQSGWIAGVLELKDGTRLKGQIADREDIQMHESVQFRSADGKERTYSPEEVTQYSIDGGSVYLSATPALSMHFANRTYFLKLIVSGAIQLYELKTIRTKVHFIKKGSGDFEPLFRTGSRKIYPNDVIIDTIYHEKQSLQAGKYAYTNDYIESINRAISDQIGYVPHYVAFKPAAFIREIVAYNLAVDPTSAFVAKEKPIEQLIYFGAGGLICLDRKSPYKLVPAYQSFEARNSVAGFQGFIGFAIPRISKRIGLEFCYSYLGASANGSAPITNDTFYYQNRARLSIPEVRGRIHLFTARKFSPYVSVGAALSKVTLTLKNLKIDTPSPKLPYNKNYLTLIGGIGFEYLPNPRHLLFAGFSSAIYSEFGFLPTAQLGYAYRLRL